MVDQYVNETKRFFFATLRFFTNQAKNNIKANFF